MVQKIVQKMVQKNGPKSGPKKWSKKWSSPYFTLCLIVNVRAIRHPLSDTIHTTTTISGVKWNEQMILIFLKSLRF